MSIAYLKRIRRGLHHTIVMQPLKSIGNKLVPVLYVCEFVHGQEYLKPFPALTEFFSAHSARSRTWMLAIATAIGKLYDYMRAREGKYTTIVEENLLNVHNILIQDFENDLRDGTIKAENGRCFDDADLYWLQSSTDTIKALFRGIRQLVQWLDENRSEWNASPPLAKLPSTGAQVLRFLHVAHFRRRVSFLAHLGPPPNSPVIHDLGIVGHDHRRLGSANARRFPERALGELLRTGFWCPRTQVDDVAAKLIAMLCAFCGVRNCEPFHLWVNDIQLTNDDVIVLLYHPVHSRVHVPGYGAMRRQEYLTAMCDLNSRNMVGGRLHAGWKSMKCDQDQNWCAYGQWLPIAGVKEAFAATFKHYVFDIRPEVMRRRLNMGLPDHPFLFVSTKTNNREDGTCVIGEPYALSAFRSKWRTAIGRIARAIHDPKLKVAKGAGTTPHGLRHNYGGTLKDMKVPGRVIQECMHHLSPLSQLVYTEPTPDDIHRALSQAARGQETTNDEVSYGAFLSVEDALRQIRER